MSICTRIVVPPVLLLLATGVFAAPAGWRVTQAPVRFEVTLAGKPTQPAAGYFMTLDDGGILPVFAGQAKRKRSLLAGGSG